jgi:hypothetical protein
MSIQPVNADQEVKPVWEALDRMNGQPKESCCLTATNLGAQGPGKQPMPPGGTGGFEQGISSGQGPGAAAANYRN